MGLEQLERERERNRRQRREFVIWYAKWVKRTPNAVWSKQQRLMIDSVLKSADAVRKKGIKVG